MLATRVLLFLSVLLLGSCGLPRPWRAPPADAQCATPGIGVPDLPWPYLDAKNAQIVDTTAVRSDVTHHADFIESQSGAAHLPPPAKQDAA